jgi:hypothetical protein
MEMRAGRLPYRIPPSEPNQNIIGNRVMRLRPWDASASASRTPIATPAAAGATRPLKNYKAASRVTWYFIFKKSLGRK